MLSSLGQLCCRVSDFCTDFTHLLLWLLLLGQDRHTVGFPKTLMNTNGFPQREEKSGHRESRERPFHQERTSNQDEHSQLQR